jgi:hypothetical protein
MMPAIMGNDEKRIVGPVLPWKGRGVKSPPYALLSARAGSGVESSSPNRN